jgi:hypothetical protein
MSIDDGIMLMSLSCLPFFAPYFLVDVLDNPKDHVTANSKDSSNRSAGMDRRVPAN